MGFKEVNEKQLRDRMRFVADKMESIWEKITPQLNEFDELKVEFEEILMELDDRGLLNVKTPTGANARENT